jgi:hypothetical protein
MHMRASGEVRQRPDLEPHCARTVVFHDQGRVAGINRQAARTCGNGRQGGASCPVGRGSHAGLAVRVSLAPKLTNATNALALNARTASPRLGSLGLALLLLHAAMFVYMARTRHSVGGRSCED